MNRRTSRKGSLTLVGIVGGLLLFILQTSSHAQLPDEVHRKVGPQLATALEGGPLAEAARGLLSMSVVRGIPMVHVWIEGVEPVGALRAAGAEVQSVIPGENLATALVPLPAVANVAALPGVRRVREALPVELLLDVSTSNTTLTSPTRYLGCNAQATHSTFQGTDIVVGVVDSGIDWDHKDFCTGTGDDESRILYLWDQTLTKTGSETTPTEFSYGVEYTKAHIDNELDGSPAGFVRETDTDGHGTHVAGIAAGDGSDTGGGVPAGTYEGVAPAADLIIVKTSFYDSDIEDGVSYIFQKAAALGKPAVVNLSLGSQYGPHDGTGAFSRAICALTGPGNIVCVSAGNDADDDIHVEVNPPGSYPHTTTFSVTSASYSDIRLPFWHDGGDAYTCTVGKGAVGSVTATSGAYNSGSVGGATVKISNASHSNDNGDKEIFIQVLSSPVATDWYITFARTATGGSGGLDGWVYYPFGGVYFTSSDLTYEEVVTGPADGHGYALASPDQTKTVICVGSYISKISWPAYDGETWGYWSLTVGDISSFSSVGPNRSGSNSNSNLAGWLKPDVVAPGEVIASAFSTDSSVGDEYRTVDGKHRIWQGTSMAAPHVTGTVALMLQANPTKAPADVREALSPLSLGPDVNPEVARIWLFSTTRGADEYADNSWDATWGFGKMDTDNAFDTSGPTVVAAKGLSARRADASTFLNWNITLGTDYIAADVYREEDGGTMRLTDSPILLQPGQNEFRDRSAPATAGRYVLDLLTSAGRRDRYGPVSVP